MTEKRFTIDVETENYENAYFEDDKFLCYEDDYDAILNRLNELHEEKTILELQLKSATNEIKKFISEINTLTDTCHNCCKEIREENEQLKQSYKEFEDECQSTFNAMSRKQNDLYRKNFKLKEENEQLKDKNNELKQEIEALKMEISELRESEKDNYNITDGLW